MQETLSLIFSHIRGMWRFRWPGLAIALLVSLAAWPTVLIIPNEYKTSSRVQVDTSSVLKPLLKGLTAESEAIDRVEMITRVMLSRPNLEKVIREADLDHHVNNQREMEQMIVDVRRRVSITKPFKSKSKRGKESPIVFLDIAFTDEEPKVAHRIVQILVNNLVESTLGEVRTDTSDAKQFLVGQIEDYERQLKFSEQQLAEFKKANVGVLPGQGGDYYARLQTALENLDALKAEYDLAAKKHYILKEQLEDEVVIVGEDPRIAALDEQIQKSEEKLSDLLLIYTENHPDVHGMRRNIAELEQKKDGIARELDAQGGGAAVLDMQSNELNPVYQNLKIALKQTELDMQAHSAKITKQEHHIKQLKTLVDTVPEVEAHLLDLNRDYDVIKQQYLALLSRLESAELSANVRSSNFDMKFMIVEPAIVPILPVAPDRITLLGAATVAGLGAGLGLMFLLNMMFPVYVTTRELSDETGYQVLGQVSMVFSKRAIFKRRIGYTVFGICFMSFLVLAGLLVIYQEAAVKLTQRLASGLI